MTGLEMPYEGVVQSRSLPRAAVRWLAFFSSAPLVWLASFYLFVLRARQELGYWPSPNNPDPKELGFDAHYLFVMLGLWWVPAAGLVVLLLSAWSFWRESYKDALLALAIFLGTLAAVMLLVQFDPRGYMGWLLD
jgi:hypothetical protein